VIAPAVKDGSEQIIDRANPQYSTNARSFELGPLEIPQLSGEMFHTVFGNLHGVYTWECDEVPPENIIRVGLCRRVIRDCDQLRPRDRSTELTSWHGGWTCEGVGLFSADIWGTTRGKRRRHIGSACVKVWTPTRSVSRTWNGVAC
jgi:hypothetical protein